MVEKQAPNEDEKKQEARRQKEGNTSNENIFSKKDVSRRVYWQLSCKISDKLFYY